VTVSVLVVVTVTVLSVALTRVVLILSCQFISTTNFFIQGSGIETYPTPSRYRIIALFTILTAFENQ
jgi:hypothetical protein